jgi:hypothetical protein
VVAEAAWSGQMLADEPAAGRALATGGWPVGNPVAGTGIYNQPFKIRVPHVQPGCYLIQFEYGYHSASDAPVSGNVCVTITVR